MSFTDQENNVNLTGCIKRALRRIRKRNSILNTQNNNDDLFRDTALCCLRQR